MTRLCQASQVVVNVWNSELGQAAFSLASGQWSRSTDQMCLSGMQSSRRLVSRSSLNDVARQGCRTIECTYQCRQVCPRAKKTDLAIIMRAAEWRSCDQDYSPLPSLSVFSLPFLNLRCLFSKSALYFPMYLTCFSSLSVYHLFYDSVEQTPRPSPYPFTACTHGTRVQ